MAKTDDKKNGSVGKTQGNKSFKYADALENCDEAIEKYMSEPDGVYYRLVHNPLHPNDDIPQPLQQWDALTSEQVALSTKVPKILPLKINGNKSEYIPHHTMYLMRNWLHSFWEC